MIRLVGMMNDWAIWIFSVSLAVKGTIAFWFKDRPVRAFMTINKHQDNIDNKANFPCEYYSIDIETLELTKIN